MAYRFPHLLEPRHDVGAFASPSVLATEWLHDEAHAAVAKGSARVFVVTNFKSNAVLAYSSWHLAAVGPGATTARLPSDLVDGGRPVVVVSRIAVHNDHQGKSLGAGLLQNLIVRTAALGKAGVADALLVHAPHAHQRAFYQHLLPDFEESVSDPYHLSLSMRDVLHTFG